MKLRNGAGTVVNVSDETAARLRSKGWSPAGNTPGPDRPAEPAVPPAPVVDDLPAGKDELVALAEAEGIEIDRRWGAARLADTIRQARNT